MTKTHHTSDREKQHAALLEQALSRPGVKEVMEVYGGWQKQNQGLDSYRLATRKVANIRISDHANIS